MTLNINVGPAVEAHKVWLCSYKIFSDWAVFNVDRCGFKLQQQFPNTAHLKRKRAFCPLLNCIRNFKIATADLLLHRKAKEQLIGYKFRNSGGYFALVSSKNSKNALYHRFQ